jgi:hypothetical protein
MFEFEEKAQWPWSLEEIEEEIKAVKDRVTLWKDSYIEQGILDEETITCFELEIEELVYPYVRRMLNLGIFTIEQAQEILGHSERELEALKRIVARRQLTGVSKVEFHYSSNCSNSTIESCLSLLKELEIKGIKIKVKAIDIQSIEPVLLIFEREFDSHPKEIYPRWEKEKLIGCKEALQVIVDKLKCMD